MDNAKQTIDHVETYIREGGGKYSDWFVGVGDNPIGPITEATLHHKVQSHRFMYVEMISPQATKKVADYFVNVQGTDGNFNGKQACNVCKAVYVYKKAAHLVV